MHIPTISAHSEHWLNTYKMPCPLLGTSVQQWSRLTKSLLTIYWHYIPTGKIGNAQMYISKNVRLKAARKNKTEACDKNWLRRTNLRRPGKTSLRGRHVSWAYLSKSTGFQSTDQEKLANHTCKHVGTKRLCLQPETSVTPAWDLFKSYIPEEFTSFSTGILKSVSTAV